MGGRHGTGRWYSHRVGDGTSAQNGSVRSRAGGRGNRERQRTPVGGRVQRPNGAPRPHSGDTSVRMRGGDAAASGSRKRNGDRRGRRTHPVARRRAPRPLHGGGGRRRRPQTAHAHATPHRRRRRRWCPRHRVRRARRGRPATGTRRRAPFPPHPPAARPHWGGGAGAADRPPARPPGRPVARSPGRPVARSPGAPKLEK